MIITQNELFDNFIKVEKAFLSVGETDSTMTVTSTNGFQRITLKIPVNDLSEPTVQQIMNFKLVNELFDFLTKNNISFSTSIG